MPAGSDSEVAGVYPVSAVARRLGIPTATLRSWNQRYRIGPARDRTGAHRLYTDADVARLEHMVALIRGGASPAGAAAATRDRQVAPGDHRALVAAVFAADTVGTTDLLAANLREHGVATTWDVLCRPAFAEVVAIQERSGGCIDVEHLLSWCVKSVLHRRYPPPAGVDPGVVLACTAGERHTLPLEVLRAALAERDRPAVMLGADVPSSAVADAVARRAAPARVLLWSQQSSTAAVAARLGRGGVVGRGTGTDRSGCRRRCVELSRSGRTRWVLDAAGMIRCIIDAFRSTMQGAVVTRLTHAVDGRPRVAVVGSGVSGLTAAWTLTRTAEVTLFEQEARLGGHADTHRVPTARGDVVPVDTAFLVHNARTYPVLLRLFAELGVATQESEMSMSVRCDGCRLEYAGARGPRGVFARIGSVRRGRYLRMLTEIPRFHRLARNYLSGKETGRTLGEFVRDAGLSEYFEAHFLTPLVAAVWSCDPTTALRYPAEYLFRFLDNHGMLSVSGSPVWRTVTGGSATYVAAIAERLAVVSPATPVRSVERHADHVAIRDDADRVRTFDAAVVATHPDQALRMLAEPTPAERQILAAMPYSTSRAVLHQDESVLPAARNAQASWNYRLPSCSAKVDRVLVSYDVTRLQRLDPAHGRFLVTLGDEDRVDPVTILDRMTYQHPQYTPESVAAQQRLDEIGDDRVAFAGAYHGWGFHEDGAASGLAAARRIGARWSGRGAMSAPW